MCVGAPAAAQRAHSPLRGALRCLLARRDRAGAARAQTFTPKAEKSGDKFTGSLAAKASVCPGADVELTLKTSGVVAANVEAANMFTSGLTLTLDCETPAPGKAGRLGEWNSPPAQTRFKACKRCPPAVSSSKPPATALTACTRVWVSTARLPQSATACR